ncbi:MAG: hypothetical protein MR904_05360 [Clostridia bacterium]|nr:hypothetical protein [Clostridia bacterium]
MKKRKFNLLLQIATLCLCVAAIVFGVYSAKTASLNVSGTIGFEAHNCKVGVVAHLTGDGVVTNTESNIVASPDGNVRRTALEKVATFTNDANGTIDFGSLYFADMDTVNGKAAPIKMTFTITNNSAFAIKASVTLPKNNNDVTVLANKDSIKIEQGTNNTGEITLTFTLNNPEASLTTALSLSEIKFDFTKFDIKKSDIEVKYTDTALIQKAGLLSNYYIKYGTEKVGSTTYDLNWFIIGTYGTDGQIKQLNPTADFTKTLSTKGETGKILKDDIIYAFLSDYILPSGDATKNATKYVPFNNNVFINIVSGNYFGKSLEYQEVDANDYSISTIRAYLNGKTVYTEDTSTPATLNGTSGTNYTPKTTGATTNFFTQNTLKDNDIYTLIQPRTLGDMYKKMSYSSKNVDIPIAVEGISETDADAFWLLSYNEITTLINLNTNRIGQLPNVTGAYNWLSRSFNESASFFSACVNPGGNIAKENFVHDLNSGVRPAFLI